MTIAVDAFSDEEHQVVKAWEQGRQSMTSTDCSQAWFGRLGEVIDSDIGDGNCITGMSGWSVTARSQMSGSSHYSCQTTR